MASTTRSPSITTSPSIAASAKARIRRVSSAEWRVSLRSNSTIAKLIERMIAAIAITAAVSVPLPIIRPGISSTGPG